MRLSLNDFTAVQCAIGCRTGMLSSINVNWCFKWDKRWQPAAEGKIFRWIYSRRIWWEILSSRKSMHSLHIPLIEWIMLILFYSFFFFCFFFMYLRFFSFIFLFDFIYLNGGRGTVENGRHCFVMERFFLLVFFFVSFWNLYFLVRFIVLGNCVFRANDVMLIAGNSFEYYKKKKNSFDLKSYSS